MLRYLIADRKKAGLIRSAWFRHSYDYIDLVHYNHDANHLDHNRANHTAIKNLWSLDQLPRDANSILLRTFDSYSNQPYNRHNLSTPSLSKNNAGNDIYVPCNDIFTNPTNITTAYHEITNNRHTPTNDPLMADLLPRPKPILH